MKPYWESKLGNTKLGTCCESSGIWYGLKVNGKTIIGCPVEDINDGVWYYDGSIFDGGEAFFSLDRNSFNILMRNYINETYNLNLNQVI